MRYIFLLVLFFTNQNIAALELSCLFEEVHQNGDIEQGVFITKDEKFITPSSDAILPSITRRSIMELAEIELNLITEERPIDLRSEFQNFSEMAACGTAAVLAPVGKIWFDEKWHSIPGNENSDGSVMKKLYELLVGIQRGEIEDKFGWLHSVDLGL